MKQQLSRRCGVFIFNENKELLIIARAYQDYWEVPSWEHSNNADFLSVALNGVFELTNIDFFNYKEEYFKPLKHQVIRNNMFIPYVIFGEKTVGLNCLMIQKRLMIGLMFLLKRL